MIGAWTTDVEGRPVLDLRADAVPVVLDDLPELGDAERAMAVRTWRGRMVNEHVSARVFAALVPQAMAAALPPAWVAGLPTMAADELRHARQCAGVVVALGGDARAPLPPLEPVPAHADVGPVEAFLRNVLSIGCLSETVAVSVIRAEHAALDGSRLGDVLAAILADEVQHARFGWRVLGQVAPHLDAAARARTTRYLVDALRHLVAWEVPRLPVHVGLRADVARAGVCDGDEARALFFETVGQVIVPQLDAVGLDASAAWVQAQA